MHFVDVGHRVVALGEIADLLDRRDVAVHRVEAFEHDELVALVAGGAQQLFEVGHVVVAEDHALRRGAAHALDHRVVVERVRQDQAIGDEVGDRRDRRQVRYPAGGEDQCAVLVVEIGEFRLELDQRMAGAGDVAGAAGADAVLGGGLAESGDHLGVPAHAEIVVGAPDRDVFGSACAAMPARRREVLGAAFEIGEDAVASLGFQFADRAGEMAEVAHQIPAVQGSAPWSVTSVNEADCQSELTHRLCIVVRSLAILKRPIEWQMVSNAGFGVYP